MTRHGRSGPKKQQPLGTGPSVHCNGKRQYGSWAEADRVAGKARRHVEDGSTLQPYKCRDCQKFHVGNRGGVSLARERHQRRRFSL